MKIQKNNSINFNGHYQGIINKYKYAHNYPEQARYACPYADRMMMKIFSSIIKSPEKTKIAINISENSLKKTYKLIASPQTIKNHMPFKLRLFKFFNSNLEDEKFWKILSNKNVSEMQYTITDEEINTVQKYFNKPKNYYSSSPEDKNINKLVEIFYTSVNEFISKH